MRLCGLVARPDGSERTADVQAAAAADGERLGRELGEELRARAGPGSSTDLRDRRLACGS